MVRIENLNNTLSNKVHFLYITLVADDSFTRCVQSAIHTDNQFISESSFTFIKEMTELFLKFIEHFGAFHQISLHFGSHLRIEWEVFNH